VYFVLFFYSSKAQNLVPNPGFEDTGKCTNTLSDISFYSGFPYVKDWVSPLVKTTPDYHNACATYTGITTGVPLNFMGNRYAHTGNAYVGFFGAFSLSSTSDWREYVECRINRHLKNGHHYVCSFFVNPTFTGLYFATYGKGASIVAIDKIGAKFSDTEIYSYSDYNISLKPDIVNAPGNFITDTTTWTKISGIYIATGRENWLTIGHFNDSSSIYRYKIMRSHLISSSDTTGRLWYLYVDDVSLIDMDSIVIDTFCASFFPYTLHPTIIGKRYLWSSGDTLDSISVSGTGSYWCRIDTGGGVIYNDTFVVRRMVDKGFDSLICADSLPVTLSGRSLSGNYLWNTKDTTFSIVAIDTGVYWRNTSDGMCTNFNDTFTVRLAKYKGFDTAYCSKQFPLKLYGGAGGNKYKWSTGDSSASVSVNSEGVYWRHAFNNLCVNYTDTIKVIQIEDKGDDTSFCVTSFPVGISCNLVSNGYYYWNTAETGNSITIDSPGIYTCNVKNHVCLNFTDTFIVTRFPKVNLGNDTSVCLNNAIVIGTQLSDIDKYLWNTGDTLCCISPEQTGLYILTVKNNCGQAIDSINVAFLNCDTTIGLPSAFSPNGDGINDILYIRGRDIKNVNLQIFNRWGQKIFESNNLNIGWDGTYNGFPQPVDVYAYRLNVTFTYGVSINRRGNITLIR
jgi:gliding motility-associated-like protein